MLSVYNVNGHMFDGADDGGTESCFHCGGTWAFDDVVDPDQDPNAVTVSVTRTYRANNGDPPIRCSGGAFRVHGDAPCEADNGRGCAESEASNDGSCRHTRHDCNCLYCT